MDTVKQAFLAVVLVIMAAAIVYAAVRYAIFYRREHFVCPKCGHCWKPPLLRMIFSVNAVNGKILRCPACGEKEYVEPVRDRAPGRAHK
ncbi:MAG TPA: hypothetical protein IAB55_03480 [Candidatus Merdivicinus faecavium]|nr:hypothetical protein [Candidatus Merdivicinus faecavium]